MHGATITTANVSDRDGALQAIMDNKATLEDVKVLLCDGGYTGKAFADEVSAILGREVKVNKKN